MKAQIIKHKLEIAKNSLQYNTNIFVMALNLVMTCGHIQHKKNVNLFLEIDACLLKI